MEAPAVGIAHVVHAHRSYRFEARIDFGGADDEAATAANAQDADLIAVDEGLLTQVVSGGAEVFSVDVRIDTVTGLAFALAPVRKVDSQGDKALFGQFLGVQIGALFLHGTHGMTDDDSRQLFRLLHILRNEEIASDLHIIDIVEGNGCFRYLIALIEIIRMACRIRRRRRLGW